MSRLVDAADRVAVAVFGVVLVALGVLGVLWGSQRFGYWPAVVAGLPDQLSTVWLVRWTTSWWWPWLTGLFGVLLMVAALRWLLSHLPARGVGFLKLTADGPGEQGRLMVGGRTVVDAAALAYNAMPGIETAVGALDELDGRLVARIDATIEPGADLAAVARAADLVSAQLGEVLARRDLAARVTLRVGRSQAPRAL